MSAVNEWEIFDFDRIEAALVASVAAVVSSEAQPVQCLGKYRTVTAKTPRVYLTLNTREAQGHRYLLNEPKIKTEMQPLSAFFFALAVEVTTQREENGPLHAQLVAKSRMALQLYKLAQSWNDALAPYHTIIDIGERQPSELSYNDTDNLDTTILNFTGQFNIDPSAWPTVPLPSAPENVILPSLSPLSGSVGAIISCDPGTWISDQEISFEYTWFTASGTVETAYTGPTLDTSSAGVGIFACRVRAINNAGFTDVFSDLATITE